VHQEVQILLKNAIANIQAKEFAQAKKLLQKAREIDNLHPAPLRLMAVIAAMTYELSDALKLIDQAIALNPNDGVTYSNKGNILKELGRYEEALAALDTAIKLAPTYVEAYSNMGNVLQDLYRYEDALEWYDRAIALNPHYAEAYSNKGNALKLLKRHEEALFNYHQATSINPEFLDAYWHKALVQLPSGDFENGWKNYEARWFKSNPVKYSFEQIPRLEHTENLNGKKILVWSEQGLGDSIQFSRYIKLLNMRGAEVVYLVPESLLEVFSSIQQYCTLTAVIEDQSIFDFQSPLLSLPLVFSTSVSTIPVDMPYIQADKKKLEEANHHIQVSKNLKVGIIWNGGFRVGAPELWAINKRRNIELDQISALRDIPGVDFYSLQKGDPAETEFVNRKDELWPNMANLAPLLNDFSDTAALITNLDLIISVDTSSAHLAGALGKPVWILNRYDSCWRWLRGREDSPWYPSAKIFQQKKPGDWSAVISSVKSELSNLAAQRLSQSKD